MKSLKLLAVVAFLGAFFTSCVADSIHEDEQQLNEIEIISSTGDKMDAPEDPEGN